MTLRSRLITTAVLLCHVVIVPRVLTRELPGDEAGLPFPVSSFQQGPEESKAAQSSEPAQSSTAKPSAPHLAGPSEPGEDVIIEALQQEKVGDTYRLRGNVVIRFRRFVLRADEVTYNLASGEITGNGHLVFDGGPHDEHLEASRASYNVRTDQGKFYDVTGTTGARFRGRQVVLTSSNPFYFSGELVERDGPDRFVVHHGQVTSCELPNPKWTFNAQKVTVEVGNQARMYHSTFRLGGIPVFYFPYAQHPVDTLGRQSGFLLPNIGQSSRKGTILGEAFYWAINRSMDATVGAEFFSDRGWAQHGTFRARPSADSSLNASYFGVLDRGFGPARQDQGGENVRVDGAAQLRPGLRAVADLEYLSSFIFRLAFSDTFALAVNSEVRSNLFVSQAHKGYFFNLHGARYQNFQSTTRGDVITILHAPSLSVSAAERRLGRSPLFWSYDAAAEGVSRREPDFVTDVLVGRFDIEPRIALPLLARGWSIRPELAVRDTYYTQRRVSAPLGLGSPVSPDINRRALEPSLEVRPPALSRIFAKTLAGRTVKHTIEPRIIYRFVTGVENFPQIIRFDARDILSNTNEVEYGVIQRVYIKGTQSTECTRLPAEEEDNLIAPLPAAALGRPGAATAPAKAAGCRPGPPSSRELLSWEIAQKYFIDQDFDQALVPGRRNVFTTTAEFSGISFLTEPRRFSPLLSRLRINATRANDIEWKFDYDTVQARINSSTSLLTHRFGDFFLAGSHAFLNVPGEIFVSTPVAGPSQFNQFRALLGYGHPNKRGVSTAANIGFDIHSGFLQYSAFQTSYNWDCCGVSFEYRRFALGAVRNENQFRFALSLANVGTFGNLRRQERLF